MPCFDDPLSCLNYMNSKNIRNDPTQLYGDGNEFNKLFGDSNPIERKVQYFPSGNDSLPVNNAFASAGKGLIVGKDSLQTLKNRMECITDTTLRMIEGAKIMGEKVGAVTTPIIGSLSRGVTQTFIDARQYDEWASSSVERWGWNEKSKFGYACGLAVRGASTLVGGAVGLVYGVWAGGKQAYDNYNNEGVFKGGWQAIANAFYACEPTRFSAPEPVSKTQPKSDEQV